MDSIDTTPQPLEHTQENPMTTMTEQNITAESSAVPTIHSTTETTDRTPSSSNQRVRIRNVVHGEWIKFWSVRSTSVTLLAAGFATVMFGMIFSAVADSDEATGPAAFLTNPVDVALGGVGLTEMIIGVLGVMVVAAEYSTGLIRTSFAAAGRRSRVIAAKAIALSPVQSWLARRCTPAAKRPFRWLTRST